MNEPTDLLTNDVKKSLIHLEQVKLYAERFLKGERNANVLKYAEGHARQAAECFHRAGLSRFCENSWKMDSGAGRNENDPETWIAEGWKRVSAEDFARYMVSPTFPHPGRKIHVRTERMSGEKHMESFYYAVVPTTQQWPLVGRRLDDYGIVTFYIPIEKTT